MLLVQAILLDYQGFRLQFDCRKHSADRWEYTLPVTGSDSTKKPSGFEFDPKLPRSCQQKITGGYNVYGAWDRGHLVTSFHMRSNAQYRKAASYMTNIVPQARAFNQGIWLETEDISGCQPNVRIYGGVVYTDPANDYFLKTHGIPTPDFMWKVLVANNRVIAWYIPNQETLGPLSSYSTSVQDIETKLNDGLGEIPIEKSLKSIIGKEQDWQCNKMTKRVRSDIKTNSARVVQTRNERNVQTTRNARSAAKMKNSNSIVGKGPATRKAPIFG
jgi:endonuclease G